MGHTLDPNRIGEVIDDCTGSCNLSAWERTFIESIADQFEHSVSLSERQLEILERIYVEKVP